MTSPSAVIDRIHVSMLNVGIVCTVLLVLDGLIHRFNIPGDKPNSQNGWYVGFTGNITTVLFGTWKDPGVTHKFCSMSESAMSHEENKAYRKSLDQTRIKLAEELARRHAKCRKTAVYVLGKATTRDINCNEYVTRKQITPFNAKTSDQGNLIVPMSNVNGELQSLQFIQSDGTKRFLRNTEKKGNFCFVGDVGISLDKATEVVICEGYATACSIHMATGYPVIAAFDAGNLKPVAVAIHHKYPSMKIIIAGDDDIEIEDNPGLNKATQAAIAVGGLLAMPSFKDHAGNTDFNDMFIEQGAVSVLDQIDAAKLITKITSHNGAATEYNTVEVTGGEIDPGQRITTTFTAKIPAATSTQWTEPSPLPEGLPPVRTLEPIMIPAPLRGWLMDIADRMQIPPDFSAAAAVVALGSLIGRGCGINPKRHDDWLVVPNLWGKVIGRPSLMKTPAITEAQKPLVRLETEAREEYRKESESRGVEQEIEKITRSAICEEIKRAVKKSDKDMIERARARLASMGSEASVTRRRFQTQDGTTEKIGELLIENPRGMLVNRDELVGWYHGLDKPGREGDRDFYLESWNGTRGYTYDRIGRGTLDIGALCISIFGAVTPGPLSEYVYHANRGGKGDDGLLQRFQVMVWPDVPTDWRNVDRFPNTTAKKRVWDIFQRLSGDISGATKEEADDIPTLRFSPEGQDIFDTWRYDLETRLRSDHGLPPSLESHIAKYRSLMPSLALIFHLVEAADGSTAPGPVSEQAAIMAAAWCDYLESHACRVYGGALMPGMDAAREIIKHIRRGAIPDGVTIRELWRPQWTRLTNSDDVKAGLKVLTEYDWLSVEKITTGGRPSEIVRLNPAIKL